MSEQQKKISIVVGVLAFFVLVGLWYFFFEGRRVDEKETESGDTVATTTINVGGIDIEVTGPGGVTIEPVDLPTAPSLKRKVTYPESFSVEAQALMDQKFAELKATLENNSTDTTSWIDLGLRYKQVGDYEGAQEAWEYASLLSPGNVVSFNNLGDLYHYYLRDYPKAEQNFLRAIQNDPKYALSYVNLHDLYRLSYGVLTTKAADILKQGIRENPENIDLYVTLATYYKNLNNKIDKENARVYYEKALDLARKASNKQLVDLLSAELEALK